MTVVTLQKLLELLRVTVLSSQKIEAILLHSWLAHKQWLVNLFSLSRNTSVRIPSWCETDSVAGVLTTC